MRAVVLVAALAVLHAGAAAADNTVPAPATGGAAATQTEPPPPMGPFDFKHFSDQTWDLHLKLARKAAARCAPASFVLPQAGGCMRYELDYLVREANDPMLSQLHRYLPLFYRYDVNRADRPVHLLEKPLG